MVLRQFYKQIGGSKMFNNEDHIVKSAFGSSIIFVVQTETLTCNLLALKVQTDETKPVD
jgi:hypothetical protein